MPFIKITFINVTAIYSVIKANTRGRFSVPIRQAAPAVRNRQ
jgi:hypothetical protein